MLPVGMDSWLKQSGASGLDDLELADFADAGRGIKTLRRFEEKEKILTIPHAILWTVKHAYADSILGPLLTSTRPPLSVDDTLVTYILFVRARKSGYDGPRSHVAALPASYSSSVFFADAELEICAGSSLYTTTKHLTSQIEVDYQDLVARLFGRHRDVFPSDKFTIDDVCIPGIITREDAANRRTDIHFPSVSTNGHSVPCGVVRWISSCATESPFD